MVADNPNLPAPPPRAGLVICKPCNRWVEPISRAGCKCTPPHVSDVTCPYQLAAIDAVKEVNRAKMLWPNKAGSAHEQFAVTDEEIDELLDAAAIERVNALLDARGKLWAHVKVNQKRRDLKAMRAEAIQVAAMALRFAVECCDETTGRK